MAGCQSREDTPYNPDPSKIATASEKLGVMSQEDFLKLDGLNQKAMKGESLDAKDIRWAISVSGVKNKDRNINILRDNKISEFLGNIKTIPDSCRNDIFNFGEIQYYEGFSAGARSYLRNSAMVLGVLHEKRTLEMLDKLSRSQFDNVSSRAKDAISKIEVN